MRAMVIADSGAAHAAITRLLVDLDATIVRHANGRTRVEALTHEFAHELVIIDEMGWPPLALTRVAEVRRGAPDARIVVLAQRLEGGWLADALRLGAAAVMPAGADAQTFRQILSEVLARTPAPLTGTERHPEGTAA